MACAAAMVAAAAGLLSLNRTDQWQSRFVRLHADGSLSYKGDKRLNVIPDFSRVGYHQGDKPIPEIPVRLTVTPGPDRSSQGAIQAAIDKLSLLQADSNGFRGTILLKKGIYRIPGTLHVHAGGVILRGEGDGPGGTVLLASGWKMPPVTGPAMRSCS